MSRNQINLERCKAQIKALTIGRPDIAPFSDNYSLSAKGSQFQMTKSRKIVNKLIKKNGGELDSY